MKKTRVSLIYEINTRVWLKQLSKEYGRAITLDAVPEEEISRLKKLGFDAVWLMGVWRPSGKSRDMAHKNEGLRRELLNVLPDLKPEDVSSSPYAIPGYDVDPGLGGKEGLILFREGLHKHGMKLILDFVPNHLAVDHPWVKTNPEYFIRGTAREMRGNPGLFFRADNKNVLAHGKDPYFPAWSDVVQLNYFNPKTRRSMRRELLKISSLCDGVRCDMAMLILKKIQKQIWGEKVFNGNEFKEPRCEFWQEAIAEVRMAHPDFVFIAEVYWGMEAELLRLGFDYAYDKSFYDALIETRVEDVRRTLSSADPLADKRLRFIENHDEKRAAAVLGAEKSKAAALLMLFAPGAHLLHQGQLEGYAVQLPIQLLRRPREEIKAGILNFYKKLLSNLKFVPVGRNRWLSLETFPAGNNNPTFRNFFVFLNRKNYLAVINYSGSQGQCYTRPDFSMSRSKNLFFKDLLGPAEYLRNNEEITSRGFYFDMPAYGFHLFKITEME